MKIIPFKITEINNSSEAKNEYIRLKASIGVNTKDYALVDRTFEENGNLSNEFRHIFVFPDILLKPNEEVIVCTGTGTNGKGKYKTGNEEYHRLYWGAKACIMNDKGGDRITLIRYSVESSMAVPAVGK